MKCSVDATGIDDLDFDGDHSLVTLLVIHVANVKPCAVYRVKDK